MSELEPQDELRQMNVRISTSRKRVLGRIADSIGMTRGEYLSNLIDEDTARKAPELIAENAAEIERLQVELEYLQQFVSADDK
jgi:hypothetical protein